MIRICFAGVTGWTAGPIVAGIDEADDLTLVSGVSRSAAGRSLAEGVGSSSDGRIYESVTNALDANETDVLIDYTSTTAVHDHVWTAVRAGVHVVVGSSGLSAADFAELDPLAREHGVGVFGSGSFSILAAALSRASQIAARQLGHWEVIDYGGDAKPDVPSGTARELAEILAETRTPEPAAVTDPEGPTEARGAQIADTQVHSVRLPSFVASTEVVFGADGERLSFRHDPGQTADPYAAGTLLAARRVADQIGVRRGLATLLFEDQ